MTVVLLGTARRWFRGSPLAVETLLRDVLRLWPTPADDYELPPGAVIVLLTCDIVVRLGVLDVQRAVGLGHVLWHTYGKAESLAAVLDNHNAASVRIADRSRVVVYDTELRPHTYDIATGRECPLGRPVEKLIYDLGALVERRIRADAHDADAADKDAAGAV